MDFRLLGIYMLYNHLVVNDYEQFNYIISNCNSL